MLWRRWSRWQQTKTLPSRALGIDYPWVAEDLDNAIAIVGSAVQKQYDDDLESARQGKATTDSKGRKRAGSLSDVERNQIWVAAVNRVIHDRVVFYSRKTDKIKLPDGAVQFIETGGSFRIEKPITGDPNIDNRKNKGERTLIDDETGQVIGRWNAEGVRTYRRD